MSLVAVLCTHGLLQLAAAPAILSALQAAPYGFSELGDLSLAYVGMPGLHHLHTQLDRSYGQMRPYVGFDLFEQRMRDSLTGLIAAVPRTTKLAYFNTQSVCDAKLAPPALRDRALACKMAQEEGCFGCPAGVEFTPGVPAACKSVVESEMQLEFKDTLMSSYGARRLAAREGEVLKEPALRRYQLVDGAMLTRDRSVGVRVIGC